MKILWCWRCKADVTMLEEDEYRRVVMDRTAISEYLKDPTQNMGQLKVEWFQRMCDGYEAITGVRESASSNVFHHRLADYGPPCSNCGKPLRTARAKFCAACGHPAPQAVKGG